MALLHHSLRHSCQEQEEEEGKVKFPLVPPPPPKKSAMRTELRDQGRRREDSQCLWHCNTGRLGDFPANGFHEKGQSPIAVMLPKRLIYYRTLSTSIVSSSSSYDSFPLLLRSTWKKFPCRPLTTPLAHLQARPVQYRTMRRTTTNIITGRGRDKEK